MRELVTAPKLLIRPHRVAVVLTTRVTGDVRLLRNLAIDPGHDQRSSVGRRGGRQNPIRSLSGQVLRPRHPRVRPRLLEMGFALTDYAFDLSRTTNQINRRAGTGSDALARLEREPERADTAASSALVRPRLLSQRVTSAGISSLFGARRPEVLLASMVSGAKHRNQLPLRHARIRGHPTQMVSGRRGPKSGRGCCRSTLASCRLKGVRSLVTGDRLLVGTIPMVSESARDRETIPTATAVAPARRAESRSGQGAPITSASVPERLRGPPWRVRKRPTSSTTSPPHSTPSTT